MGGKSLKISYSSLFLEILNNFRNNKNEFDKKTYYFKFCYFL